MIVLGIVSFLCLGPTVLLGLIPLSLLASGEEWLALDLGGGRWLAIMPLALGGGILLLCTWDFARAGQGTPALWQPARGLVTKRLYRVVRNPMYLGAELIMLGESVAFESLKLLAYAILIGVGWHLVVVWLEEPYLRVIFGTAYEEYCHRVPRWIPDIRQLRPRRRRRSPAA
jgi:protein-S-isoprenylcysteine O-methyltransferase Ste14